MIVLRVVLIVQALLLAARCKTSRWNPDLVNEEEERLKPTVVPDHAGWNNGDLYGTSHDNNGARTESPDVSETTQHPHERGHADTTHTEPSLDLSDDEEHVSAGTQSPGIPARTGNWCAFVHKRMVSVAVACGTERYSIKSQEPCQNEEPGCQLVIYKLATRPVYRAKQNIFTTLLWRCCPGHGGKDCEEIVSEGHVSTPESSTDARIYPGGPQFQVPAGFEDLNHNQHQDLNDHDESNRPQQETLNTEENRAGQHSYDHPHSPHTGHEHHHEKGDPYDVEAAHREASPQVHSTNQGLVPIHYLKDVIMSHLQPIFDSFNLTLARLSEEVQDLQRDMTQLQLQQMLAAESKVTRGGADEVRELLQQQDNRIMDSEQQLDELRMELSLQRDEIDAKLHAQQIMLHYNLTSIKTDTDVKIKRSQKMLQMGVQSFNSSLSEIKMKQEDLEEELQRFLTPASTVSSHAQPREDTAIWEAITRLDNKVVNSSIQLTALNEEQIDTSRNIEELQRGWRNLEDRITKSDQNNQDRYIEAFLEVDGAKTAVQTYAADLAKNVTSLHVSLQEMETDVDYLFTQFYKNMSAGSKDCDCGALSTAVAQLKLAVANVSILANENRLALDTTAEERIDAWENGGWGPPVEDIKVGLSAVQRSLKNEQEKRKILQENITSLQTSLLGSQLDIEALQQQDRLKAEDIKRLTSTFASLLKDAIRHTEILEILLGEEVLEFMDWSPPDQESYSIPALRETIRDMQDQINRHSQSLATMLNSDEPAELVDWSSAAIQRTQGGQKHSKNHPDDTEMDLLALKKAVVELQVQIKRLEEKQCSSCCNCTKGAAHRDEEAKLRAELTTVHKSLEDHLRIFSRIFSNTEGLSGSEATLDLDKLLMWMNRKEDKTQSKKEKKRANKRGQRNKRDALLNMPVHSQLPQDLLMFLASSRDGINTPGTVVFETASLNHGQTYSSETGVFRAPTAGFYMFVFTLDFGTGPNFVCLKRGQEVVASLHQSQRKQSGPATRVCIVQLQQGDELHVELMQGTVEPGRPQDNTFAGLLLLHTT